MVFARTGIGDRCYAGSRDVRARTAAAARSEGWWYFLAHLVKRKLKGGDRWYVRYYLNGTRRWLAAGTNRRRAERIRDAVAAKILEGRAGILTDRSDWTVADLAAVYLDRWCAIKPRSAKWRKDRMGQVTKRIGEVPLEDLDVGTLERYAHERLGGGSSVATINADLAVLRHAVGCAVRWREETGLQVNRLLDWRPLRGIARAPTFLEKEEVARIVTASAARGGAAHVFIQLFLATGARPGELLRLKREDFGPNTVRLPALKGGVSRVVVVDSELSHRAVEALPLWTKDQVRAHWRFVRKVANLRGVRFYDLRHTVASEMLRRGATMRDLQRLLGHTTARMTERYAHFSKTATALEGMKWDA